MATETETNDIRNREIIGGPENEDTDFETTVRGMLKADFEDWPNEAGFEGLNEIRGPVELSIKGSIPAWASGTLYRTGPGQYIVENTPKGTFRTTHWFDGLGQSHKFSIIPNFENSDSAVRVEYTSRRQSQALYDAIKKDGKRPDIGFGQKMDPCIGLFGKIMSVWRGSPKREDPNFDNVSVAFQANVPGLPSKTKTTTESGHRAGIKTLWLTTDNGNMKEIDQNTLEPIGIARQQALHPLLRGPLSCAHAQRDPETGDYYNYNLEMGYKSSYRVFRTSASTGVTEIIATISAVDVKPAYIHSFYLTSSFAILCIPSSHLGTNGIQVPWKGNMVDAIENFDSSKLCRWFVVDRLGNRGVVAMFDSPAAFYFHSVNSFEERDEETGDLNVYCDVMQYPNLDVIRAYEVDVMLQRNGAAKKFWGDEERNRSCHVRLTRWKLGIPKSDTNDTDALETRRDAKKMFEIKAPHAGELPTINPTYATKKHRYIYSIANRGYSTLFDTIVKTDVLTHGTTFWDNPSGHTPGEPIFVPRPRSPGEGGLDEDDGVLLSVVLDGAGKTSYLLCLDAKTLHELGRAECDFAIGFGFHGMHWPAAVPTTS
ncbi:Beta,beta-carotene 15,15'-monooxygenase [Daldinia childiae]|uniref:Beta,beta-carotene 15,15'-monooxygenase n=1 Tax=Daldinia childiae TaxID=326645 RepID=UPI001445E6D9|nr:Beta,beta-carotene 15,15'-monooxygenase [Daldinia childiae]KAF3063734.1 Beta,beta-carotene 15,15'-monooxygenase [Daldinia childiae]